MTFDVEFWSALAGNALLMVALAFGYSFALPAVRRGRLGWIGEGLLFGAMATLMLVVYSYVTPTGSTIDGQSVVVVLAALFASRRGTLLALLLAVVGGLAAGGDIGFTLVGMPLAMGIARFWRGRLQPSDGWDVSSLSQASIATWATTTFLLLPVWWTAADDRGVFVLVAGVYAVATIVAGLLLELVEHRERVAERLESAMSANMAFLLAVNHEIRTPLTELVGFSDTLTELMIEEEREDVAELAGHISKSGFEISDLLRDLAASSRLSIDALDLNPADFDAVRSILDWRERPWMENVLFEPAVDVLTVTCDESRTRQILRNLVQNAKTHGQGEVRITAFADGTHGIIRVSDEGEGLETGLGEEAFALYKTTGNATGPVPATGIGLWLCRSLAEKMGGSLTHSVSDGRAHFDVALPLAPSI